MRTIQYSNPMRTLIFMLCSLSLLMMTAGKCKKTNNTTYITVKFNSNGGSAVDSVRLTSGSKVTKPADPTRVNYTFGGWYSDAGLTQTFDFNTPITKDITLYAKWNAGSGKISYNVTFNSNGGSVIVTQQVIAGEKATKPVDPTRDKYTFAGWYSDAGLTQAFDFNTPITKAITLYAKWDAAIDTKLSEIIKNGAIPNDLSGYDIVSQQVLSPYVAGAKLSAIYITESGAGKQDGTSWDNAKPKDSLKSSIDNISDASSNKVYLVLIGAGTYTPGASIAMKNNVGIIGGFPATGGWIRSATDTTAISGDNKYFVIFNDRGLQLDHTALLYGVKITAGYAGTGGGMLNFASSPTITNVVFSGNTGGLGGGLYNDGGGNPILTNVIFSSNRSTGGGGGGVFNADGNPIITNVMFVNNTTRWAGGGMNISKGSPILTNVIFINNIAENSGSIDGGGGLAIQPRGNPILINVAFINNKAPNATGGGIYNFANSSPVVVNAIFWGNTSNGTDPQYNLKGSVNYSVVQDSSRATLSPTNPVLSALTYTAGYFMPTVSYTGTSPDNLGVYVKRTKTAPYTLYYSTDGNTWYTDPTKIGTGTAATLPAASSLVDLTATDIQGRPRKGRPNAGVWAK